MGNAVRIEIDPHVLLRCGQRQATEAQVRATIERGEQFPAREGRTWFRKNFSFAQTHNGNYYESVQVLVVAQPMDYGWLAVTVITKFF